MRAVLQVFSIAEPAVLEELNAGRFEGDVSGCVVMENEHYRGHVLFSRNGACAHILDSTVSGDDALSLALRACLAKCLRLGAVHFDVNMQNDALRMFWQKEVCTMQSGYPIETLLRTHTACAGCQKNSKNT